MGWVSLAGVVAVAAPQDSLTVEDAVVRVLSQNPALAVAAHSLDASKARVRQSRSGYLPSADVEASYTYLAPVSEFIFGGTALKVYPDNNWDGHVGLRQTIFDFHKTGASVDLADSRVTLAEDNREMIARDLTYRCVDAFYGILFLRKSIEVQDEQIRTLNEHLEVARKKIAGGTATELDALTTQVRVAASQTEKIQLENALRKQEITFRQLTVLQPGTPLLLKGEFTSKGVMPNRDSLLSLALKNRVEARMAAHQVVTARAQREAAGVNDAPALSATIAYGVKNGFIPNIDVLRGNIVAGVQFKLPLLDGSRTRGMEEEAEASVRMAEARSEEVNLAVHADVEQAIAEAQAAGDRLAVSAINIDHAERAVKDARLRYDAGTVANIDLLDAETERAEARLTNLRARYDLVISRYHLRRAIGIAATEQ
jgi:outer membrane protein TolC